MGKFYCPPIVSQQALSASTSTRYARGGTSLNGLSDGRELSAIKNVACETGTTSWQRGHLGVSVLPLTPTR